MKGYHPLSTTEDLRKLWKTFNDFENDVRIVTMNRSPVSNSGFPDLELYLSGEGVPMVKIVFYGVLCWKIDNEPIIAIELKSNDCLHLIRLWHKHSSEKDPTKTTSWIPANRAEWKCVRDRFE